MLIFILGIIFGILIILSILIYYKKIKKVKKIGEIVFVNRSVLCLILFLVNKIFRQRFIAITNLFNSRVHIVNYKFYSLINEYDTLYKHEYVHILQSKKYKRFIFIVLYLFNNLRGYSKNKYEIEAYELENKSLEDIKKYFNLI